MPDRRQTIVLIAYGLALWLGAAFLIRFAGPAALGSTATAAASYAATVPGCWASVWLARRLARLDKAQLVGGAAIVCATAMILDGLVLMWAPGLYGSDEASGRTGGAWLLWGYGVSLLIALVMARTSSAISDNMP